MYICHHLPSSLKTEHSSWVPFQLDVLDGSRAPEMAEAAMRSLLQEEETAAWKRAQKEKKRIAQQKKKAAARLARSPVPDPELIDQTPAFDPASIGQLKAGSEGGSEGVLGGVSGQPQAVSQLPAVLGVHVDGEAAGEGGAEHSLAVPEPGSMQALLVAQLTCPLSKVGFMGGGCCRACVMKLVPGCV